MSHQFKVGDPALVVGGVLFLGRQVTVLAHLKAGESWTNSKGIAFQFAPEDWKSCWVVGCDKSATFKRPEWLIPLRGDFTREQKRVRELTS
ncbi:hypothetical protein FBY06_11572 [Pseudomonas sp. SJZ085]|uniref:hypothetical protein n=1 Tax=unclassified Pseudomonas TaxID=196821 RepID=UPI00119A5422|nr:MULTISPECIES: hypothetical protein [unclassified Pseudomonas]TWC18147.1 hypothetical protein FBX99_11572 [Pseudomonas sp. SJZ074]TWC36119.1 hypothetical protein FBY06_11572 [Pseudomonas sp. SJZ085]